MVAVIGDIHGCFYTLVELYNKIRDKYPGIDVYSVGDLVDRGNHSFHVVDFITERGIKFTPGNHDYMFSHYYRRPDSIFARSWNLNGSESTLKSYEGREGYLDDHLNIIDNAPLFYNLEDCFISHAGISSTYLSVLPDDFRRDLSVLKEYIHQDYLNDNGVLWTRDILLNLGKLQIVGHTKQFEVAYDEEAEAVYIDTGACIGNKLTAVIVEDNDVVETIEENTHLNDIL